MKAGDLGLPGERAWKDRGRMYSDRWGAESLLGGGGRYREEEEAEHRCSDPKP